MFYDKSMITSTHFKKVPEPVKDELVSRVNEWYKGYARSKNVREEDMADPISEIVRDFLSAKLIMMYAFDNTTQTANGAPSMYQVLLVNAKEQYNSLVTRISAEVIKGSITNSSTTVVFGRRHR